MPQLNVYLLPDLVEPEELSGHTVVVVDVLRATTTIAHALAAGAERVIPCLEVEQARQLAADSTEPVLLGGERAGKKIDGFDFGNSPEEYTPEAVAGRTIVFTTTNGTRAMQHARQAKRILLGAFVNLTALCDELASELDVDVLCAGTNGEITREDVLFAGAVVSLARSRDINDQARIAAEVWTRLEDDLRDSRRPLHESLRDCTGARNLIEIGLKHDIEVAAQVDRLAVVPELELRSWEICCRSVAPASNGPHA